MEAIHPVVAAWAARMERMVTERKSTGTPKPAEDGSSDTDEAERRTAERLAACGIHARYRHCTFEALAAVGIPPAVREQYEAVREYAADLGNHLMEGTGLILRGPEGTMKTSLAVAVLQSLITSGRSGYFITMPSLVDTIFTLKEQSGEEWLRFEDKLRNTPLLLLDDLGAEYATGWVLSKVDAIISERYNRRRPVIVTTNLTGSKMNNTYTARVLDRLHSTCQVLTFTGRSLRLVQVPAPY